MLRNMGADSYPAEACYTKWGFGTRAAIRQMPHTVFISVPAEKQYWQISFSPLPTLFNRRGNNSICCTWLEPGMRKLWMISLPGIWPLKSSRNSHGAARRELQRERQTCRLTLRHGAGPPGPHAAICSGLMWSPPSPLSHSSSHYSRARGICLWCSLLPLGPSAILLPQPR